MIKDTGLKYISWLMLMLILLTVAIILSKETLLLNNATLLVGLCSANAFFFLYEAITINIMEKKRKTASDKQIVNLYLLFKVGRILFALLGVAIYAFTAKVELKRFVLFFVLIYFIYLLFNTLYLTNREKKLKK